MLTEVPDAVSSAKLVEKYWPHVIGAIFDGFPLETHLEFIENSLVQRERLISQGALDPTLDWATDIKIARKKQADNIRWISTHQATRDGYIDFWRSMTDRVEEYSEKLAISGMSLIVGFHGAVALGSIKILSERDALAPLTTEAAKVALPCAVVGIALFAIGKLVAYHVASALASQLRSKLINPKNSDFAALSAIVQAQSVPNIWAIRFIYGSLFWFLLYSIVIVLILLQG
jgi:hypothetical protein